MSIECSPIFKNCRTQITFKQFSTVVLHMAPQVFVVCVTYVALRTIISLFAIYEFTLDIHLEELCK